MNSFTQQIKDSRQQSEIQSFYEPALRVLGHLFEVKKQNLRNKGYDENNAAVTKACLVDSFGGYVKPKDGE
ncbi:hypothetical protein OLN43_16720 [Acinetobacter baumannii]|uniref:hypothetical protein n=1 Tax=Acinetobacter baumannii TaxID=470 RepID=UPI00222315C1|nr:hypothetical protein [Acinetobacter baumannii]MCW1490888.1 hypothetical protein [Acinetobacter baumannii]